MNAITDQVPSDSAGAREIERWALDGVRQIEKERREFESLGLSVPNAGMYGGGP